MRAAFVAGYGDNSVAPAMPRGARLAGRAAGERD